MADLLVRDGFRDAGYDIVGLDDCWMSLTRDADDRLQADPIRFPNGIKYLADYVGRYVKSHGVLKTIDPLHFSLFDTWTSSRRYPLPSMGKRQLKYITDYKGSTFSRVDHKLLSRLRAL